MKFYLAILLCFIVNQISGQIQHLSISSSVYRQTAILRPILIDSEDHFSFFLHTFNPDVDTSSLHIRHQNGHDSFVFINQGLEQQVRFGEEQAFGNYKLTTLHITKPREPNLSFYSAVSSINRLKTNYFVSSLINSKTKEHFFGQELISDNKFPGGHSYLVIKSDKEMNIQKQGFLNIYFPRSSRSYGMGLFSFFEKDGTTYSILTTTIYSPINEVATIDSVPLKASNIAGTSLYCIEHDDDLKAVSAKLLLQSDNYALMDSIRLNSNGHQQFSLKEHVLKDPNNRNNNYIIGYDQSPVKIDSIQSTHWLNGVHTLDDKRFLFANYSGDDSLVTVGNVDWVNDARMSGLLLFELDALNNLSLEGNIQTTSFMEFPRILAKNGKLFLHMMVKDSLLLNGLTIKKGLDTSMDFTSMVISLSKRLELKLVAENFSSNNQYNYGTKLGQFDVGQNYFFLRNYLNGSVYYPDGNASKIPDSFIQSIFVKQPIIFSPNIRPDISIQQTSCSSAKVDYKRQDAEHYTLLVSTNKGKAYLSHGDNYNYSPDYIRAPKLDKATKVLYQGSDTSINVSSLVAGRRYYFTLIPGNGLPGFTVYNHDSIDTLSVFIPTSIWKDSISISPDVDTGTCEGADTLELSAQSPWPIRWMDGKTNTSRVNLKTKEKYSFISKAPDNCLIGSDSVKLSIYPKPTIASIKVLGQPPFCEGDTVVLKASTNGSYLWGDGSSTEQRVVTESGTYEFASLSIKGCRTSKNVDVTFHPYPWFQFNRDSIIGYSGKLRTDYTTNADSLSWHYNDSAFAKAPTIAKGDYLLKVDAYSAKGCFVKDSVQVRNYDVQESIFPNAFSPNGDGLNDVWYYIHPDTLGILTVFDRWGCVVFHGNNYWDGKKRGELLPVGAYEYVFTFSEGNSDKRMEGTVHLLR